MTIVVAAYTNDGRMMMVSDSLATCNGIRFPGKVPKIITQPDFMLGIAGSYHCLRKVQQAIANSSLRAGLTEIVDYLHAVNNHEHDKWDSECLFINAEGISLIDGALGILSVDQPFHAIGSGQEAALGCLLGEYHDMEEDELFDPESVEKAAAVACHLNIGCGGPLVSHFLHLPTQ
jgi:ATP-dependent protease HslVU (ClpYQ) peptidase subunit